MSPIRVLASFNVKKCVFSLEALEGDNKDRVIEHVNELILRQCKFSKNKEKTAGVIGIWDSKLSDISTAVRQYFGDDEDENGYSPTYFYESIKYDTGLGEYIVNNYPDPPQDSISNDNALKQLSLDNAAMIYLKVDEEECEGANDIKGIAFYWRSKKAASSIRKKIQEAKVNDLSAQEPMDFHSELQGKTLQQCPECEGSGFVTYPCDECGGDPDQIGGTGCSKCGGDGCIELECPTCNGDGEILEK